MSKTFHRCGIEASELVSRIAEGAGLTLGSMCKPAGPGKEPRNISHVRQRAMYDLYETGKYSQSEIGRFLGGRDISTVWFGINAHARRSGAVVSSREPITPPAWFNLKPVPRDLQRELIAYWKLVA